jgi:cell division protein FtsB
VSAQARAQTVDIHETDAPPVRLNARAVALLLIALAVMLLAITPIRGYLDERGELRDLKDQATVLERQNDALHARILQLSDPTFLERIARECLGMVRPGETAFVVVPAHGKPHPPDC